jgi:hypothetical protein
VFGIKIASMTAALLATAGMVGCSQTSLTVEDAYKIGCPAIDATVASGSVANDVAVATLKEVRDRGNPAPEAKKWIDASIELLTAEDPGQVSKPTKKLIIKGCKQAGHPLQNLK